jgi:ubiquinone/menaquinone biosynthesis C-methylase UbiE
MEMQSKTIKIDNQLPVRPKKKWNSIEQYIEFLRHFMAYEYAEKFVKGKSVLEIGCGTGYGANQLSRFASNVIAIDVSRKCIRYCHTKHKKGKMTFLHASGLSIPLKDSSVDVALSFQVIEHIEPRKVRDYLTEIKRVLNDEGVFVISTPNKKLRLLPFQRPWNPQHRKEYSYREFKKTLRNVFENVEVYGLRGSKEI